MATLTKFPCFSSVSPHKLFLNQPEQCQLCLLITHGVVPQKRFRIYACSAKKPRGSRKVKSNVELCNDIREFVATVGFPEGYVPTMKEFSDNGRTDLANIVRRRGYKLMRELLANTPKGEVDDLAEEENVVSSVASLRTGQDEKVKDIAMLSLSSSEGSIVMDHSADDVESMADDSSFIAPSYAVNENDEKVKDIAMLSLSSSEGSIVVDHSADDVESMADDSSFVAPSYAVNENDEKVKDIAMLSLSSSEGSIVADHSADDVESMADDSSFVAAPSYAVNENDEKVKDIAALSLSSSEGSIVADHSADDVESMAQDISSFAAPSYAVNENDESVKHVFEESSMSVPSHVESNSLTNSLLEEKVANFIQNGELDVLEDNTYGIFHESSGDKAGGLEHAATGTNSASILNGSIVASEFVNSPITVNRTLGSDQVSAEIQASVDLAKDLDVETSKMENQVEVNQLKLMLHQKELELTRLKDQIEKEKLALAALQEKAEAEINRAQKLISEKDAELHAAEETLSGLVEVKIQYSGDAETVEVAGSFNGWNHPIQMEPQPFASLADSVGSRESRVWLTILWLYPGAYEIKFIVDGHWTTDPQMEKVNKGGISNNILRVDR